MRIAILGVGFMGSALTIPATDNGHAVALWGTHLDGDLVEAVRRGRAHPKLKLELCSALKNAYAIGIGLCDGLVAAGRAEALYNTKALIYTQALAEMAGLVRRAGGRPETVSGLAGAGDLHVTGAAGRNRIFGELRGSGLPTRDVVTKRKARDELTEGYAAIRWCWRFAEERGVAAPLLRALHRIVYGNRDVEQELRAACWGERGSLRSAMTKGGRK